MHEALVVTYPGLQETASKEVFELTKIRAKIHPLGVTLESSLPETILLTHRLQSASRVLLYPEFFEAGTTLDALQQNIRAAINAKRIKPICPPDATFKVECERFGEHGYTSMDAAASAGEILGDILGLRVDVSHPTLRIFAYIDGAKGVIGVDMCGFDISKRYYKVFSTPSNVKGTTGYLLARLSEPQEGGTFLDPLCGSGVIAIELAHHCSCISLRYYQLTELAYKKLPELSAIMPSAAKTQKTKQEILAYDSFMPNVAAAKKNAKISGMQKLITFGRMDFEWLDVKFQESSITSVATNAMRCSQKQIDALAYQLAYILSPGGHAAILGNETAIREAANRHKLSIVSLHKIGRNDIHTIVVLGKK